MSGHKNILMGLTCPRSETYFQKELTAQIHTYLRDKV